MPILPFWRKTIPVVLTLLIAATVSYGAPKTVEVTGFGECADCLQNNIKHSHALKGLKVNIDCKLANGQVQTRGSGELDEQGKFRVDIPNELLQDGKLKEECYAQLHGASHTPCPTYNGIESSKLASLSESSDGKHTFSPVGKLKFSSATCTSAFLWPHFKDTPIVLPKIPHYPKKTLPKIPVPVYHKPLPPPVPVYHKTLPPLIPKIKKPYPPIFKKKPFILPPLPKIPHFPKKPLPKLPFPKVFSHPKYKLPSWGPTYPPHY